MSYINKYFGSPNPAAGGTREQNSDTVDVSAMFNELLSKVTIVTENYKTVNERLYSLEREKGNFRGKLRRRIKGNNRVKKCDTSKTDSVVNTSRGLHAIGLVPDTMPGNYSRSTEKEQDSVLVNPQVINDPIQVFPSGPSGTSSAFILNNPVTPVTPSLPVAPLPTPALGNLPPLNPVPMIPTPREPSPKAPAPSAPLPRDPSPTPGPSRPWVPKRQRSTHDSSEGYNRHSDYSYSGDERRESKDLNTRPKRSRFSRYDYEDSSEASSFSRPPIEDKTPEYCKVLMDLKNAYPQDFKLKSAPAPKGLFSQAKFPWEEPKAEEFNRFLLPWSLGIKQSLQSVDLALAKQVTEGRSTVSFSRGLLLSVEHIMR